MNYSCLIAESFSCALSTDDFGGLDHGESIDGQSCNHHRRREGIGEATAIIFAREGAKVSLAGRRVPKIQAVADRIKAEGGEAIAIQTDVRCADQVQNLIRNTIEHFGKLDILFNNAGVRASRSSVVEVTEEEYERTMATDLKGLGFVASMPSRR